MDHSAKRSFATRGAALALLLGFVSAPLSAQIYTWVDEDGVVHYADQPRSDNAETSNIKSKRTDNAAAQRALAAAVKLKEEQTKRFYDKRNGTEVQDPERSEEQIAEFNRRNCEAARSKQSEFAEARRFYKLDENGAKAYLTEEEIAAALADVEAAITQYCE
ncbi:MAG: DUF4124 domain-containing protein [Pseudomonadota bacterium]